MKEKKFRKSAGIIIILLFLVTFIPTALGPAEGTAVPGTVASAEVHAPGAGTTGQTAGRVSLPVIGVGTIAVGTAIAETAMIAVAVSQPNAATIH